MKTTARQDRAALLATANAIAKTLKAYAKGTQLRVRLPRAIIVMDTDGWRALIGDLGKGEPRLEVWLDRITGYAERKFYVCFRSNVSRKIIGITKRVSRNLWPVRVVNEDDTSYKEHLVFTKRLRRFEFNAPILEKYRTDVAYYGMFDPTRRTPQKVSSHFCARAVAFFEDVARALPHAATDDEQREVYPRFENRKQVASHLHRERSKLLAAECKIRDNYQCQVCSHRFGDTYGKLGFEFAEAHHIVPLSRLREGVRTRLDDLKTVCANCHRMLHRMDGKPGDIAKLKTIVRKRRA